jgi:rubrerythrin
VELESAFNPHVPWFCWIGISFAFLFHSKISGIKIVERLIRVFLFSGAKAAMDVFSYTADEIVQTAIQIENNASQFYKEASGARNRPGHYKELFLQLSVMENDHARMFTELRRNLSPVEKESRPYDPGNEMLFYLRGMAGLHGWEGKAGPNVKLTGEEKADEVITIAVAAEKDTVFFYGFLKDYVPRTKGRDVVDKIMKEEMKHVALLYHELTLV